MTPGKNTDFEAINKNALLCPFKILDFKINCKLFYWQQIQTKSNLLHIYVHFLVFGLSLFTL